jgi:hypothetical protein
MAWAALIISCSFVAAYVIIHALAPEISRGENTLQVIAWVLEPIAFAAVGVLVAIRRPDDPLGWLLCLIALGLAVPLIGDYALMKPRPPGAAWFAWFGEFSWTPVTIGTVYACLLFPTGRFLSDGWKWAGRVAVIGTVLIMFAFAFTPGPMSEHPDLENPAGLPFLADSFLEDGGIAWALFAAGTTAAVMSLIVRFTRSRGEERVQMKWFVLAVAVLAAGWTFYGALTLTGRAEGTLGDIASLAVDFAGLCIPAALGIAILRYRLYDIDRIISRTVSYALLTAALLVVYLAGVLGLQAVLRAPDDSPVIVALSTLAMVTAFGPLRRRIQGIVDRRFNRGRFDGARTIEAFAARMRDEVDIDDLTADLVGVVQRTIEPASVSLWLIEWQENGDIDHIAATRLDNRNDVRTFRA